MDQVQKRKQSFLLRLPVSLRDQATCLANSDGTSLNHFISLAVAEKIARMDRGVAPARSRFEEHRPNGNITFRLPRSA